MAFSVNSPIGDGVTTQFAVSFTNGLYSRDNVHVFVGDETTERAFTWINDGLIDVQGTVPAVGEVVTIRRIMDKTNKAVDFADGEILDERNLDTMVDQLYNISHEFLDGYGLTEVNVDIDMRGNSLTNVATDPNDPNSIATVGYTSGAVAAAEASEAAAAASEAAAAASASSAGSSQASALGYYEDFVSSFYGELASDPTQNPLGDPVKAGDMYFNTTLSEMRLYSGTDWQPVLDAVSTLVDSQEFTNAAGQTTFTLDYNTTAVQVYYNGVLLSPSDYTANTGTEIVLATPVASDDDIVSVQAWSNINVSDKAGFRTELDVYSKAEVQEVTQANANILINGDFQVWQRGESFPSHSTGYHADRWATTSNRNIYKSDSTPPNTSFSQSLWVNNGTGSSLNLRQAVELPSDGDAGVFQLNETFTVSGYVKVDQVGRNINLAVSFTDDYNFAGRVDLISLPIYVGTGVWEKFEHTFDINGAPLPTNKCLTFQFSSDSDSVATDARFTGLKLERGSVATPFEYEPYGDVLAKCQRYFFKYNDSSSASLIATVFTSISSDRAVNYQFPVTMRVDPTLSNIQDNGNWSSLSSVANIYGVRFNGSSVTNNSTAITNMWADAEL